MIYNIDESNFLGNLRMGDLIAVLNIIHQKRIVNNNPSIKFYIPDSACREDDYIHKFKKIIKDRTDYLSDTPGNEVLSEYFELWNTRNIMGDLVTISNPEPIQKKICIFPLLDATYDTERNWPISVFQQIVDDYSTGVYVEYEKIICVKDIPSDINPRDFKYSTDFEDNINHILTCEYYIGGGTGLSLFASVLDNPNRKLLYYYHDGKHGAWKSVFTRPFYVYDGKGILNFYTLDGKIYKLPENYIKNEDGLIRQIKYSKITYDEEYVKTRYDTYGELNEYISHLRLGYIVGTIGKIPESILDVGYGNGAFLKTSRDIINNCYGSDISGYPLPENIQFVDDWINLPVEVLTLFDTLEHFDDPYVIKNSKAQYIVVSVPWCDYESDVWFMNWKHRRPNEHLWFFDEKNIFRFAERIGFHIINYTNLEDCIRKVSGKNNILTFTMKRI